MLVVDMSKPWTALDSLQKWASVVREHVDKLKIPPEEMKEMEQKCEWPENANVGSRWDILADYKSHSSCFLYKEDSVKEIQYDSHFEI